MLSIIQTVESAALYFLGSVADSTACTVLKQKNMKLANKCKAEIFKHYEVLPVCNPPQLFATIIYFC